MIIQATQTLDKSHFQIFIRGEWFACVIPENFWETYHINFLIQLNKDLDEHGIECLQLYRGYKFIDYLCKYNSQLEFIDKIKYLLPILRICFRYSLYEEYVKTISYFYDYIMPHIIKNKK